MKITILGNPATKKNSMQICKNKYTGKIYLIQSKTYREYEKKFIEQCNLKYNVLTIEKGINLTCIYFMQTKKKVDLVNLLNATCDCLVKAKIIKDDNFEIINSVDGSEVRYDKNNPRVEIYISYKN